MAARRSNKTVNREEQQGAVYFRSLTVRKVRCFGDEPQRLELSRPDGTPARWTILLGNNGTGKTTLLQCLALLSGQFSLRLSQGSLFPSDLPDGWESHRKGFVWYGKQLHRGRPDESPDVTMESEYVVWSGSLDAGEAVTTGRRRYLVKSTGERGIQTALRQQSCFGYGPTRRPGSTHLRKRNDRPFATLFSDAEELRNPQEWLLQLDYSASKGSEIADRLAERKEQVRLLLIDLLPDIDDIEFTTPTAETPSPDVRFKTPYGWVPLDGIAHGYQSLLAWIVDFASRLVDTYPESPNPLTEAAVCLVDEIDLHLHPSWQRDVMAYLADKFPNTQFIATAHSPLIVQSAPSVDANVAVLRRNGDHVVIDNDADEVRGWRLDQILASDLFSTPEHRISPRAPEVQEKIAERRKILEKPKLNRHDKQRLKRLDQDIGQLPVGETPEQIKALQLLEDSVSALQKAVGPGK